MIADDSPSEDHADILASYADSLLLRWNMAHQSDDIRAVVSNLESALEKLPPSSTKVRYNLLMRLATVYETLHQNYKEDLDALSRAIQYWEDAYGLSAVLRLMKEAANEILPSLSNACLVAFQNEISGLDSLNQAIHYYQVALAKARLELQNQLRLGLGKVYLELMYYTDEAENAQSAIDCFEVVLKKSNERQELIEASNGKSQGWWWKIAMEKNPKRYNEDEEYPFRVWVTNVATTYRNDVTAVCYYALSFLWMTESKRELTWFHIAWALLRSRNQSPPPGFHYMYSQQLFISIPITSTNADVRFEGVSLLLTALEHLRILSTTATFRDLYMVMWTCFPSWTMNAQGSPVLFDDSQWDSWKEGAVSTILTLRGHTLDGLELLSRGAGHLDTTTLVESQADFKARLEARIVKPKHFRLNEPGLP
ncbi:hypothetical protein CPB86DRAFT_876015 [Serendipita vermifera]|nr:hypothetical protein CPB86DRAFT_876015 [Serendipita vermifera]